MVILVGGFKHGYMAFIFHFRRDVILPVDELIFFRGVGWNHQPDIHGVGSWTEDLTSIFCPAFLTFFQITCTKPFLLFGLYDVVRFSWLGDLAVPPDICAEDLPENKSGRLSAEYIFHAVLAGLKPMVPKCKPWWTIGLWLHWFFAPIVWIFVL